MTEDPRELSTALRRSVTSAVDGPSDPMVLLRGVEGARLSLVRRDRRRAVAAVVASVVGVAVVTLLPSLRANAPAQPVAAADTVPAGTQAVSWHGVQVFVPETWTLDDQYCGAAQTSTVLVPGVRLSCLPPYVPGLTVVDFLDVPASVAGTGADSLLDAATTPTDLSGTPGLTGSVLLEKESGVRRVLVVPSEGVIVTVRSPDAATADRILATARVVQVDANGCASRLTASRPTGPSPVAGSGASLLPGTPTRVSACRYEGLRLVSSRRVAGSVPALQRRLDALATGVSGRTPANEIAESYCAAIDDNVLTLDADYDGQLLRVFFRGQACTDRSVLNGSTTRRSDVQLLSDLYAVLAGRPMQAATDRTAERPQPAPELGYEQVGALSSTGRADLLAGTDSATQVQLLGLVRPDGTRCVVAKRPAQTDAAEVSCGPSDWLGADRVTVAVVPATEVLVGVAEPQTRTVRVVVDGRHVGTWATFGGGSAYDQRRFFLGQLPAGEGRVEITGFDSLGSVTSTATLIG